MTQLTDSFERKMDYLRIFVTDRCNFRCQYCMPEDIKFQDKSHILTLEEMLLFAEACLQLGVCFRRRGMEGTAVEWLQRGITAGGDEKVMGDLLYQLTLAYEAQGKEGARNAALEQLKALAPDHPGLVEFSED